MPLTQFCCSICGKCCPKKYLAHGKMDKRMSWLRNHRKRYHPTAFERSIRKGVKARR